MQTNKSCILCGLAKILFKRHSQFVPVLEIVIHIEGTYSIPEYTHWYTSSAPLPLDSF